MQASHLLEPPPQGKSEGFLEPNPLPPNRQRVNHQSRPPIHPTHHQPTLQAEPQPLKSPAETNKKQRRTSLRHPPQKPTHNLELVRVQIDNQQLREQNIRIAGEFADQIGLLLEPVG